MDHVLDLQTNSKKTQIGYHRLYYNPEMPVFRLHPWTEFSSTLWVAQSGHLPMCRMSPLAFRYDPLPIHTSCPPCI